MRKTIAVSLPKAKKNSRNIVAHGHTRVDDYFWMNERENPEVIAYLEEENSYYKEMTKHTEKLQEALFVEMKSRIKEDDESVPYFYNGYYYITRFEKEKDYPVYTRKKGSLQNEEEIVLDVNEMAEGQEYFHVKGLNVSEDNIWLAFGVDTVSRREYTIYVKNLQTGEILALAIEKTTGNSVWASDNRTLFYSRKDSRTLRADKIFKHTLGTDVKEDRLVYFEEDESFSTFVYKEKSHQFVVIGSESTMTSEYRVLESDNPNGVFRVVQERIRGLEYEISHYGSHFYILTNADGAVNFKLMRTKITQTGKEFWEEVIPHREEVLLEGIDIFKAYLVISERTNGLTRLHISPWNMSGDYYLPFDSETYTADTVSNIDFDTSWLRYAYQSMNTPASIIDFNMETQEVIVRKEQEVIGGYAKEDYKEERVWALAKDGTSIPISLVYKKECRKNEGNPLLLYGYGSYGASMDPFFSTTRLSLLDRGFIYAIAHVRGGEELGREWYEEGKLLKKKNTFTDFIDCSKFLIQSGYTSAEHLYAEGGSAGGMLMGVVVNEAPELYHGVIVQVPFVDVVTTMLDDSIPLTTGEYDEWGNPNEEEYYRYMLSYSPYDNVKAQNYPHMYVSTGFHDSQVQYWEPAKWVAKLRELKTDTNLLFLDTNMKAGHGGASGRYESLKELAKEFAFLLDLEGF